MVDVVVVVVVIRQHPGGGRVGSKVFIVLGAVRCVRVMVAMCSFFSVLATMQISG